MTADPFLALKLISAMFVLALVAVVGFDRPTWSRTFTTVTRFRFALAAYVLMQVLVMLVLYLALRWIFAATGIMGGLEGLIRPSSPIWLSVTATLLLFAISAVADPLRRFLQRAAGVPDQAHKLAALLGEAQLEMSDAQVREARDLLEHRGIEQEQHWLQQEQATQNLMLRATRLHLLLRKWPAEPHMKRYVAVAKNDLDLLRQRFDELSLRISRSFGTMEHLGEITQLLCGPGSPVQQQTADLIRKIIQDMLREMCADISEFCSHACLLIARGVMCTEPTAKTRQCAVAGLGFRVAVVTEPQVSYGALAMAAAMLYFGVALFFALVGATPRAISGASLVIVITLTQVGALTVAIVPKTRWGFANAGLTSRTPVDFVIGAGVAAVLLAVAINLLAGALLIGGWQGSLTRLGSAAPYLISPFATAATTAWLVQDHRWRAAASSRARRWLDAATMGLVWLVVSAIATELAMLWIGPDVTTGAFIKAMVGGFVIGGALGAVVPAAFRIDERALLQRTGRPVIARHQPVPAPVATRAETQFSQRALG
jgi:hypothetical protein